MDAPLVRIGIFQRTQEWQIPDSFSLGTRVCLDTRIFSTLNSHNLFILGPKKENLKSTFDFQQGPTFFWQFNPRNNTQLFIQSQLGSLTLCFFLIYESSTFDNSM